jgi:hypothetical protein
MAPTGGLSMTASAAAYLIHHVVLPPRLPQKDDYDATHEHCLIDAVVCALQDLQEHVGDQDQDLKCLLTSAVRAITNLADSRDEHGDVSEIRLLAVFKKLKRQTHSIVPWLHFQDTSLHHESQWFQKVTGVHHREDEHPNCG